MTMIVNINELINSTQKEPNYVDLGLPSGTLWAECNVGANIETECGKYFLYDLEKGFYYGQIDNELFTGRLRQHLRKDGCISFEPKDGSVVPNRKDVKELCDNCRVKRIINRGVSGTLFDSKINNNSIFFVDSGFVSYDDYRYPTKTILRKDVSKLWLQGNFFKRSAYSLWLGNSKPFVLFDVFDTWLNIRTIKRKNQNSKNE